MLRDNLAHHAAFIHRSVGERALRLAGASGRHIYATPRAYLELLGLYRTLLRGNLAMGRDRHKLLSSRLARLRGVTAALDELRLQLTDAREIVEKRSKEVAGLLIQVGQESALADDQAEADAVEEEKVSAIQGEVEAYESECASDLAAAEPAANRMDEILGALDKTSLVELRNLTQPPKDVESVLSATLYLLARKVDGPIKKLDVSWGAARRAMASLDAFLVSLRDFDRTAISAEAAEAVRIFTGPAESPDPKFSASALRLKSRAASQLCDWVINVMKYHEIYRDVEPKRRLLEETQERLEEAKRKLAVVHERSAVLEERKASLQEQLLMATEEKNEAIAATNATQAKVELAERLVRSLTDECERWQAEAEQLERTTRLLTGDAMCSAAFVAYAGPFPGEDRAELVVKSWLPDMHSRAIPASELHEEQVAVEPVATPAAAGSAKVAALALSAAAAAAATATPPKVPFLPGASRGVGCTSAVGDADPLRLLGGHTACGRWHSHGLPDDRHCLESAAILEASVRHPLMLDPQRQAVAWLQASIGKELKSSRPANSDWLEKVRLSLEQGTPLLLEDCSEKLPALLAPVLRREFRGSGRKLVLSLDGADVDVMCSKDVKTGMPKLRDGGVLPAELPFRLYLQTRLANPHYGPEIQAHAALLDFSVTEHGLAEALLHIVASYERPSLVSRVSAIRAGELKQTVRLDELESQLLAELAASESELLEDTKLVSSIEQTKRSIQVAQEELKRIRLLGVDLRASIDVYRPVGTRGAVAFSLAQLLSRLNPCYIFEYTIFARVFRRSLEQLPHVVASRDQTPAFGGGSELLEAQDATAVETLESVAKAEAEARSAAATRVPALVEASCYAAFSFVSRALFVRHRLLFAAQFGLRLRRAAGQLNAASLRALLFPLLRDEQPPASLDWMPSSMWSRLMGLEETLPVFDGICANVEEHSKRWREWCEAETPEREALPHDWKKLPPFETLLVVRALRPDRIALALSVWLRYELGPKYTEPVPLDLAAAVLDAGGRPTNGAATSAERRLASPPKRGSSSASAKQRVGGNSSRSGSRPASGIKGMTPKGVNKDKCPSAHEVAAPILFLLSPGGVDVATTVRTLAKERLAGGEPAHKVDEVLDKQDSFGCRPLTTISLGGGPACEGAAETAIMAAAAGGGWVVLNNIDLAAAWLPKFEAALDSAMAVEPVWPEAELRVFLTASASARLAPSLLQRCVILATEPPAGIKPAMISAYTAYGDDMWEAVANSPRLPELKAALFALAFFHASVCERRRAGPVGWSGGGYGPTGWWTGDADAIGLPRAYPFSEADLREAAASAVRIIVAGEAVKDTVAPWDALIYHFGEVIYGGHVEDPWDRRLMGTLLSSLFRPELLDGGRLAPKLDAPPTMDHKRYIEYINETLPRESPQLLSFHPSSQNGVQTAQARELLSAIESLSPANAVGAKARGDGERGAQERAKKIIDDLLARVPNPLPPVSELRKRAPLRSINAPAHLMRAASEVPIAPAVRPDGDEGSSEMPVEVDDAPLEDSHMNITDDSQAFGVGASVEDAQPLNEDGEPVEPQLCGSVLPPCVCVLLQECDRMSALLRAMRTSMRGLDAALRGEVALSDERAELLQALQMGRVPHAWAGLAWPSLRPLGSWVEDLLARHAQLAAWTATGSGLDTAAFPLVTWLGGLFNPRALLTALLQQAARSWGTPLDAMQVSAEVTKKSSALDVEGHATAGGEAIYISGLYLHGARWDMAGSGLDDASGLSKFGQLQHHEMPLLMLHAKDSSNHEDTKASIEKAGQGGPPSPELSGCCAPTPMSGVLSAPPDSSGRELYVCPVYRTRSRGTEAYVFAIPLRTRAPPSKWVLAGVALMMDCVALAGDGEMV